MRAIIVGLACLLPPVANACDTYTSEMWDEGEVVALYQGRDLTIVDHGKTTRYAIVSGGNAPYNVAWNLDNKDERLPIRKFRDVLIISMEIFTPYCPSTDKPDGIK